MGAVKVLVGFGLGLLGAGWFWMFTNDILTKLISKYIFNSNDPYYAGGNLIWVAMPYVIIIVGVICLVASGVAIKMGGGVVLSE